MCTVSVTARVRVHTPERGSQAVDELVQVLDAGEVAGVVLTGPAGVGKTSLATAVLDRVAASGRPQERLVATPAGSSVPFATLSALVAVAEARHDRG